MGVAFTPGKVAYPLRFAKRPFSALPGYESVPVVFDALGRFAFRRRWQILIAIGLWFVCALALLVSGGRLSTGTIHDLEAERANILADAISGHPSDTTFIAIFES